mgnify:CR=1 FL=1
MKSRRDLFAAKEERVILRVRMWIEIDKKMNKPMEETVILRVRMWIEI